MRIAFELFYHVIGSVRQTLGIEFPANLSKSFYIPTNTFTNR